MNIILFISVVFLALILNHILVKKRLFLNFKCDNHQKFISSKNIPLSGGWILIFTSYYYLNLLNFTYVFFIFCVGFLSDTKIMNSPKLRFIIQTLIVLGVIYFSSLSLQSFKFNSFSESLFVNSISSFSCNSNLVLYNIASYSNSTLFFILVNYATILPDSTAGGPPRGDRLTF